MGEHCEQLPEGDAHAIEATELAIGAEYEWVALGEEPRIDISTRRNLKRLLRALVEASIADPQRYVGVLELIRIGWPGERLIRTSAANRLYAAISTLRRMGLRSILERASTGYRIRPGTCFRSVTDSCSRELF